MTGFSTRNVDPGFNIEGRSAIAVRVKCDKGMRYKVPLSPSVPSHIRPARRSIMACVGLSSLALRLQIILRDREGWDTVAWCHSFDARKGQVRRPPLSTDSHICSLEQRFKWG